MTPEKLTCPMNQNHGIRLLLAFFIAKELLKNGEQEHSILLNGAKKAAIQSQYGKSERNR